jgi:hypothetical protein
MNTRYLRFFTALALTAGATRGVYAADQDSPWGVSIIGGDSVAVTGKLRSPATSSIGDLGTIDPAFTGSPGAVSLDRLRYDDLFRHRYDTGLELDYSLNDNLQTYGRFTYDGLSGRTRNIGEISGAALATPAPLRASFSDVDSMGLELGSRYFWRTGTEWTPFAGAALGATRTDGMRATLSTINTAVPDTALDLANIHFTRTGTVFSQSAEAGIQYDPSRAFGVRFSVNADHIGAPKSSNDPALAEFGLDSGHGAQSRWAFPVAIAAAYHFG